MEKPPKSELTRFELLNQGDQSLKQFMDANQYSVVDVPTARKFYREYYIDDPYLDVIFYPCPTCPAIGGFFYDPTISRLELVLPSPRLIGRRFPVSRGLLAAIRRLIDEP